MIAGLFTNVTKFSLWTLWNLRIDAIRMAQEKGHYRDLLLGSTDKKGIIEIYYRGLAENRAL